MPQEKRDLTLTVSGWPSGSPGRLWAFGMATVVALWRVDAYTFVYTVPIYFDGPVTLLVDCRRRWRRVKYLGRAEKMELQMELSPFLSTH